LEVVEKASFSVKTVAQMVCAIAQKFSKKIFSEISMFHYLTTIELVKTQKNSSFGYFKLFI
jgi:hypothetical protein